MRKYSQIVSIAVSYVTHYKKEDDPYLPYQTEGYFRHIISEEATNAVGAQWLSGRVIDSRPRGRGFEPHWRHCVVVLEQDIFILA